MTPIRKIRGMSLTEFMIASSLGLFILSMLIANYLSIKDTFRYHEAIAHIQETANISAQLMLEDIQDAQNSAYGTDDTGFNAVLPAALNSRVKPHTDVLIVTRLAGPPLQLPQKQDPIIFPADYSLTEGDKLLFNHGLASQIRTIAHLSANKNQQLVSLDQAVTLAYPLEVTPLEKIAYFVGKDNDLHRRALWKSANIPDAVLSGVVSMEIKFAEKHPEGLRYVAASAVKDWHRVMAVEIHLLLSSPHPVYSKPHRYWFAGSYHTPEDLLMHRPLTFYAAVNFQDI